MNTIKVIYNNQEHNISEEEYYEIIDVVKMINNTLNYLSEKQKALLREIAFTDETTSEIICSDEMSDKIVDELSIDIY